MIDYKIINARNKTNIFITMSIIKPGGKLYFLRDAEFKDIKAALMWIINSKIKYKNKRYWSE